MNSYNDPHAIGTLHIGKSAWKSAALVFCGVLMTACSLFVAMMPMPSNRDLTFVQFIGWFGAVFFGLCSIAIIIMVIRLRGPIVTISWEGVVDRRTKAGLVPWSAIVGVTEWKVGFNAMAILRLEDAFLRSWEVTEAQRVVGRLNAAVGVEGLPIQANMFDVSHAHLMDILRLYFERYGRKDPSRLDPRLRPGYIPDVSVLGKPLDK
jgi:hypothetical protein